MDKLLFKRILIGTLTALMLIYVIYLLFSANFNVIQTENATKITVTDKIYSEGFIVRNEEYIKNDSKGYIAYELGDGGDIEADGIVAKIYNSSSDAVARQEIESIEEKINNLTALTTSYYSQSTGLDVVDNELNNQIISFLGNINKCRFTTAESDLNNLLSSINKRQLITGQVTDFSTKITELSSKKQSIENSSSESTGLIKSPKAGYFVSACDGFEKSVDYSKIAEISVEDYDNIKASTVPENVIGKVVRSPNWYVVCKVPADDALNLSFFENEDGVTIEMPFSSTESIPATIVKINQTDSESDAVVIFKCNYMNSDLADARKESVEIGIQEFTGLRVSKQALHDDVVIKHSEDENGNSKKETKKVQGVYVLHGSEIQFKEVSVMYSGSDYVICDPDPEDGVLFNGETVQLYDKVVTQGDKLYDGKIVN